MLSNFIPLENCEIIQGHVSEGKRGFQKHMTPNKIEINTTDNYSEHESEIVDNAILVCLGNQIATAKLGTKDVTTETEPLVEVSTETVITSEASTDTTESSTTDGNC